MGDLVQREHSQNSGGIGVGSGARESCNISETAQDRLLLRTNRKSHARFRMVPKSMTLDDPERLKRHSCRNKHNLRSRQEKFQRR